MSVCPFCGKPNCPQWAAFQRGEFEQFTPEQLIQAARATGQDPAWLLLQRERRLGKLKGETLETQWENGQLVTRLKSAQEYRDISRDAQTADSLGDAVNTFLRAIQFWRRK